MQPKCKKCIRCGKEKPFGEFHKDKNSPENIVESVFLL